MTKDVETRAKFIEMRAEGHTLTKIVEELDISYNTAVNWNRYFAERIEAARAIKLEELLDKYLMAKGKKIELFGERLLAIKDEMATRDPSEVPTAKLFDMLLKCQAALEKEMVEPRFMTESDMEQVKTKRLYVEELFKGPL
jgi:transposase